MATKAKTTTKKKVTTSASAKKTTARVVSSSKVVKPTAARRPVSRLAAITPNALAAEAVGTLGLTLAMLSAPADQPLLVGLVYAVLLIGLMRVSGGHFNPAVTFGLWAANKVEGIKVPFYFAAQFIGAIAALLIFGSYNGGGGALDMSTFMKLDGRVFWVEFIGTALFLFGFVATLKNASSSVVRAAGIGLSLATGLVIAGGLITANATNEQTRVQSGEAKSVNQTFATQGAALNPAIALAQTERDVDAINQSIKGESSTQTAQKKPSHMTLSVVGGSLLGAALGANLYLLLVGLSWKSRAL